MRTFRKLWHGLMLGLLISTVISAPGLAAPDDPGPCTANEETVTLPGDLEVHIHYPTGCGAERPAPYPALVFAHGFSMFGLSNGAADNAAHGEHLASWGYIVAIPLLPDDAEERITAVTEALDYLVSEDYTTQDVDTDRLGAVGYSLGGATALALTARDARLSAVVALDPVYHASDSSGEEGDPIWDVAAEAPDILVPTGILGGEPHDCNAQADYLDIFPLVGATHKAQYLIVGASHCDFANPGSSFCSFTCGSGDPDDEDAIAARTARVQRYATAWLDYYLYQETDRYTYLYGAESDADVSAGTIEREIQTAPRALTAEAGESAITLQWDVYTHPMIAGYAVYRRTASTAYARIADLGVTGAYIDTDVSAGTLYTYTVCSYDPAEQMHQRAAEVQASLGGTGPTPTSTSTATPCPTPEPTVYDEYLYLPLVLRGDNGATLAVAARAGLPLRVKCR